MKKSIAFAALLAVLGTSVFAAAPSKVKAQKADETVSFSALKNDSGFGVSTAEKSTVIFYDQDNNVIFKDRLSKGAPAEKGYIVTGLDNGTYTVEVKTGNNIVKKQLHVYEDEGSKSYFFMQ